MSFFFMNCMGIFNCNIILALVVGSFCLLIIRDSFPVGRKLISVRMSCNSSAHSYRGAFQFPINHNFTFFHSSVLLLVSIVRSDRENALNQKFSSMGSASSHVI